jgi:hypothetical protein
MKQKAIAMTHGKVISALNPTLATTATYQSLELFSSIFIENLLVLGRSREAKLISSAMWVELSQPTKLTAEVISPID